MQSSEKIAKQRLISLFSEIEKEFDIILEENLELKRKIALLEKGSNEKEIKHGLSGSNLVLNAPSVTVVSSLPDSPRILRKTHTKEKEKRELKKLQAETNSIGQLYPQKSDFWVHTTELSGHRDGVWEVSACPWSLKRIGSASADRTARVWTLTPTHPQILYLGHSGSVNSIRFHPKERIVCTASGDKTCHIWKIPSITKKEKENFSKYQKNNAKNTNRLWSPLLGSSDHLSADLPSSLDQIDNSPPPSSKSYMTMMREGEGGGGWGGGRNNQQQFDRTTTTTIINENYAPSINNYNNSHFAPSDFDVSYEVNDITLTTPLTLLLGHSGPIVAADWISNGTAIASVSWDNSIALWDPEGGTKISSTDSVHEEGHTFTNINRNGDLSSPLAITSSTDGVVRVWDLRTSKNAINSIIAHESGANSACFSSTEETVVFSGGDDRACRSWDLRNCKQPLNVIRCSSAINRFSISPISSTVAIPLDDRRTKLCDVTGNRLGNLRSHDKGGHTSIVTATAWSNDESVVYTSSFSKQKSIIAWTKDNPKRKKIREASDSNQKI